MSALFYSLTLLPINAVYKYSEGKKKQSANCPELEQQEPIQQKTYL
jgi:hypothetical protein